MRNFENLPEYLDEIKAIVDRTKMEGRERLFEKIPKGLPIHPLRHKNEKTMYLRYTQGVDTLIRDEQYHCRAEMEGLILDKTAMLRVKSTRW